MYQPKRLGERLTILSAGRLFLSNTRHEATFPGALQSLAHQPRCLVVEDQALIALSIEAYLEDEGFEVVTLGSSAETMAWLSAHTPECVILDYSLRDGPCLELARELSNRRVPFMIYSGHRPSADQPELRDVPWIEKPVPRQELIAALKEIASFAPGPARCANDARA